MDARGVLDRRLRSVRLAGPLLGSPADVVGWFGAVQAQDHGPASWSVGQRLRRTGAAEVARAFAAGEFLRTHVLRPTWHFVRPDDIVWLQELTGPRVQARNTPTYVREGLDERTLARADELVVGALSAGEHLTRDELGEVLRAGGIDTSGLRLGLASMHAELEGLICSGALRGKQHTYALVADRAPGARRLSRDEALAELALRYLTSHGPATAKDLRWWSGLTLKDVTAAIHAVSDRLERLEVDGTTYWWVPEAPVRRRPSPVVDLVQIFDEYVVAFAESRHLAGPGLAGERPAMNSLVLLDGRVAGHWRRTVRSGGATVEALLARAFSDAELAALETAVQAHGAFLGLDVELVVSVAPRG